jgi:hypothetical protein
MAAIFGVGQMGHGNQFELAVVDAKDIVSFKIQAIHIALYLLILCGVAKAEVAIVWLQPHQVTCNPRSVIDPK